MFTVEWGSGRAKEVRLGQIGQGEISVRAQASRVRVKGSGWDEAG
jgi:hypothetical protein